MTRLLWPVCLALGVSGCGAAQDGQTARNPLGTLRVCGKPTQGSLEIDETHVGPLGMFCEKGVLLPPGTHRIVATAVDYLPEYRIVEIKDGEVATVNIELREVPL